MFQASPHLFFRTTSLEQSIVISMSERIDYKLFSLTYKVLTTTQPSCLHDLITVHTRSSSLITLARPSTSSSLRITDRSFQYILPLVSGINSRLPSVNHALISPILTHSVLPPSVPSTHHSRHPLLLHSFIPRLSLKPFFSANPSRQPSFSSSGLTPRIPQTVYRYL